MPFLTLRGLSDIFKNHSVSVFGSKGSGKDVLFGNVINYRDEPYVSNTSYGGKYRSFKYSDIDIGCSCHDLIRGRFPFYSWPHEKGADIYLSDCGIYFPSQYCSELNKHYPSLPIFMALSRHLARNAVHTNTQFIGRVWDKIREQSDKYIYCEKLCKWLLKFGIVYQKIIIYDKYESAASRVKPCRVTVPLTLNPNARIQAEIYKDNFFNQHGSVTRYTMLYFNRSKHNTYFFEEKFKNGGLNES